MNKKLHNKNFINKNRVLIVFIILCCSCYETLHAGIRLNESSLEQILKQKTVTINVKNSPIKTILYQIQKQSGVSFVFKNEADSKSLNSMTLNVKNVTVENALNTLFAATNFTYKIIGETVTITKKTEKPRAVSRVIVVGKVLDNKKDPIVGVTVIVEGTPVGAITNTDGSFSFLANSDDKLEISCVGKKTINYTKPLTGASSIILQMEDDMLDVEEVVVTGYGDVSKKMSTGAQTTLKMDDIIRPGAMNVAEMLQGQVAGMIVTNNSARAGATPKIQIRGQSTILGNQDPIWVVDGVIQDDPISLNSKSGMVDDLSQIIGNQVSWLNPNDIESITVLKDASATAIYGSRASNGVIVIKTKKTKGDKISVNYSGSMTVKSRATYDQFNFMDSKERLQFSEQTTELGMALNSSTEAYQYQKYTYEGAEAMYLDKQISRDEFLKARFRIETLNTDWLDILTRTSISQSHNVSIGASTEKASYRVSLGYADNKGQEIANNAKNFTVMSTLNLNLSKKVRVNFALSGAIGKNKGSAGSETPLGYATRTNRGIAAFNEDGTRAFIQYKNGYRNRKFDNSLGFNILNEIEQTYSESKSNKLNITGGLEWEILKNLRYKFSGNYSINQNNRNVFRSEQSFNVANTMRGYDYGTPLEDVEASGEYAAAILNYGGIFDSSFANSQSYNIQNQLMYSTQLGKHHTINAMFGHEVRSSMQYDYSNSLWGYVPNRGNLLVKPTPPESLAPGGIGTPTGDTGFGVLDAIYENRSKIAENTQNYLSLFLTFAYSFKDRYVLNVNARNDFSNAFGQDVNRRFDPTYSFGAKWCVTQEKFMKNNLKWLNAFDLTVTYGVQGNALTAKTPELILRLQSVDSDYKEFYSSIQSIPNRNLSWEKTTNWNYSVNGRVFNAINFSANYYKRSSNAIIAQIIPLENGINKMDINGGMIYNSGMEFTVAFSPVVTRDFGLNVSLNSSKNWNRGGEPKMAVSAGEFLSGNSSKILMEGYPLGGFWRYSFNGLNPEDGLPMFNYMDMDKETVLKNPSAFLEYVGQKNPLFTGGINLSVRYKRLTLSTTMSLLLGGYKILASPFVPFGSGKVTAADPLMNLDKDLLRRWQKPGDEAITNIPSLVSSVNTVSCPDGTIQYPYALWANSTAQIIKNTYFRCGNISLSYALHDNLVKRIGLSSLRFSGSMSNPFVIANKKLNGFDPELNNGIMPRSYSFSVSLGF